MFVQANHACTIITISYSLFFFDYKQKVETREK